MSNNQDSNPFNTPDFVREREAWYKAGAHAMALIVGVGSIAVGLVVGIASLLIDMSPHESATAVVVGIWGVLALAGLYTEATARSKARRGGVPVERF